MISFELASIFAQLQAPEQRAAGCVSLGLLCGAHKALLFCRQNDRSTPAPGLPPAWFDEGCQQGRLRDGDGDGGDIAALSLSDPSGEATIVFFGHAPERELRAAIVAMLPLLAASLRAESIAVAAGSHAEAAREASRRELESRREAERRLRDADRRKDEFLAMLAHELRNPLAPISMAAQILKIGPSNPARLQQTCQIIERQVTHMTSLLDDLLDVSRVTGGIVTLAQELHDMRQIVDHALEQARPLINARGHHLTLNLVERPACVYGDGTRLVQIVTNLLTNAAKYTPAGGDIGVKLALRGDQVVLTVRDSGVGIDSALLPHVFELFIQGERSSDRSQGGLGLGLALVKSLAERHGGAVSASSAGVGRGSAFDVSLPHAALPGSATAPLRAAVPESAPHSILIVDDNADAARTLALFLQSHGHSVQVAFDGAQALKSARASAPRVLLLDIGLPDMDGYALARHLRDLPATRDCVYIALTGYGCPEDRERSRKAGFDHHLTKPVNALELVALLGAVEPAHH